MNKKEALKIMFGDHLGDSTIEAVYNMITQSTLAQVTGKVDVVKLDEVIEKCYGEYEGSMKDFFEKNFDKKVADTLIYNNIL